MWRINGNFSEGTIGRRNKNQYLLVARQINVVKKEAQPDVWCATFVSTSVITVSLVLHPYCLMRRGCRKTGPNASECADSTGEGTLETFQEQTPVACRDPLYR